MTIKTIKELEEAKEVANLALAEGKKKMKEADNTDEVDVKKDKPADKEDEKSDDEKPADKKDGKKENPFAKKADKEDDNADKEDDKEDDKDKEKANEAKKKKALTQSYREEDQPAVLGADSPFSTNLKIKESVATLFDGETLSEDFKKKAEVIFEAVLTSRINEEIEKIEACAQTALAEEVAQIEESLMSKADDYIGYVVSEWLEENKLQVESSLKTEIYESFFDGLKELFVEHNITVPAEKVDILEDKKVENAKLVEEQNVLVENLIEANKTILSLRKQDIITELAEGLAATQAEKLKSLTADIEAKDVDIFKEKATIIRENFFKEETKTPVDPDAAVIPKEEMSDTMAIYVNYNKDNS